MGQAKMIVSGNAHVSVCWLADQLGTGWSVMALLEMALLLVIGQVPRGWSGIVHVDLQGPREQAEAAVHKTL